MSLAILVSLMIFWSTILAPMSFVAEERRLERRQEGGRKRERTIALSMRKQCGSSEGTAQSLVLRPLGD